MSNSDTLRLVEQINQVLVFKFSPFCLSILESSDVVGRATNRDKITTIVFLFATRFLILFCFFFFLILRLYVLAFSAIYGGVIELVFSCSI